MFRNNAIIKIKGSAFIFHFKRIFYHIFQDKEKELEVRNIYQNRIAKAKRAGSVSSLPALEPPARYQPPPRSPDVSPRRRAQEFEQKRREEQKAKAKEVISCVDCANFGG